MSRTVMRSLIRHGVTRGGSHVESAPSIVAALTAGRV
jgi:hypothetical protein